MMKKFLIILAAIVIVLGGTLMYLNHMNYWPFKGDKVSSIPDGEIKTIETKPTTDELSLLLAASGEIAYNVKGKSMDIYFDVYHQDKRVTHEMVTGQSGETNTQMSGYIVWGIPGFDTFKPTEIRVMMRNGESSSSSQSTFVIPKNVFDKTNGQSAQTQPFEDGKIKKGKPYIMQSWFFDKEDTGIRSSEETFSKKDLKNRDQTVLLYVVFK
ncbi:hypothetical protein [Paenilisteria newyorkensis]|uniref:hypothetical protein n=1 Tax=Listeria newyorkensis TaxID=1497681 RepID=UPI000669D4E7|nr:hypothetical protein [Listeria newyorkensis]KMT63119.1 hypothetical protein X559_0457 [Listeria newyorkensis]